MSLVRFLETALETQLRLGLFFYRIYRFYEMTNRDVSSILSVKLSVSLCFRVLGGTKTDKE